MGNTEWGADRKVMASPLLILDTVHNRVLGFVLEHLECNYIS